MEHMNFKADWDRFLYDFHRDIKHFSRDIQDWMHNLSTGEAMIGLCLFTLVLLFIMIRRPQGYKQGGGMTRQFVLAMTVVVLFGFGAGYLMEGWGVIMDLIPGDLS